MKYLGKIMLFLSSYFLLFLILFIEELNTSINQNFNSIFSIIMLSFYFILILLSIISIVMFKRDYSFGSIKDKRIIKISSISNGTSEIISYLLTMVIPLIGIKSVSLILQSSWSNIITMILLLLFILILYINTNLIVINPMLIFFGYSINKISFTYENSPEVLFEGILLSLKNMDLRKIKSKNIVDELDLNTFILRRT